MFLVWRNERCLNADSSVPDLSDLIAKRFFKIISVLFFGKKKLTTGAGTSAAPRYYTAYATSQRLLEDTAYHTPFVTLRSK